MIGQQCEECRRSDSAFNVQLTGKQYPCKFIDSLLKKASLGLCAGENAPTPDDNVLESFTSNWIGVRWMCGRENPFGRPQTRPSFMQEKNKICTVFFFFK